MADTKRGRVEQAHKAERRQRRMEVEMELERATESEPLPDDTEDIEAFTLELAGDDDAPVCHRRGCLEPATFVVLERYLEETSHSPVEANAMLCSAHTEEEGPTRLEAAYDDYVFRIDPLPAR